MTTIRLGVIGTGVMAADHVDTISKSTARAEVRAVADIDVGRAEAVAARVPGAKAVSSAEALIESADIDVVIIASSNPTHAHIRWPALPLANRFFAKSHWQKPRRNANRFFEPRKLQASAWYRSGLCGVTILVT